MKNMIHIPETDGIGGTIFSFLRSNSISRNQIIQSMYVNDQENNYKRYHHEIHQGFNCENFCYGIRWKWQEKNSQH